MARDNQSLVSVIEKLADRVKKLERKLNDRRMGRKQQQPSCRKQQQPSCRPQSDNRQPVI